MSTEEVKALYDLLIKAQTLLEEGNMSPDYISVIKDKDTYIIKGILLPLYYGDPTYFNDVMIKE